MNQLGIIDLIRNPFATREFWIKESKGLTNKRQEQLLKLFGREVEDILKLKPVNYGKYVALTAIRWGFAEIINGKLLPTKKWDNRQKYDEYGQ